MRTFIFQMRNFNLEFVHYVLANALYHAHIFQRRPSGIFTSIFQVVASKSAVVVSSVVAETACLFSNFYFLDRARFNFLLSL